MEWTDYEIEEWIEQTVAAMTAAFRAVLDRGVTNKD